MHIKIWNFLKKDKEPVTFYQEQASYDKTTKMKNIITLIGTILLGTILSHAQKMQDKAVSEFTAIELEGKLDVTITQGTANAIKAEVGDDNSEMAKIIVNNGVLEVTSISGANKPVTVYITAKGINKIEMEGQVNLKTTNEIIANKLEVESETIGSTYLDLNVKELDLDVDAVGSVTLKGKADKLKADIEGVGSLNAFDLVTRNADINMSGIGGAKINVTDSLLADVSGIGSVEYKGNPYVKKVKKSGVGGVSPYGAAETNVHNSNPQTSDDDNDTTRLAIGSKKIVICENEKKKGKKYDDDDFKHWSGPMIGINGYTNFSGQLAMPSGYDFLELDYAKSWNFQLNIFQKNIHLYKNYLNLVTGMGFEFATYAFKNNIVLMPNNSSTMLDPVTGKTISNRISAVQDSAVSYDKNKLKAVYLNVPLLIEWHSNENPKKAFHIAAGATAGYRLGAKTKQTYEQNGDSFKRVIKDDYHLSPFKVSATAMVGYSGFTLYANYGLTELFNKNEGPVLYPFSAGVSLNF